MEVCTGIGGGDETQGPSQDRRPAGRPSASVARPLSAEGSGPQAVVGHRAAVLSGHLTDPAPRAPGGSEGRNRSSEQPLGVFIKNGNSAIEIQNSKSESINLPRIYEASLSGHA